MTGGTGCDDFTTDLSGVFEVLSTGGWRTFETRFTYVPLKGFLKVHHHHVIVATVSSRHMPLSGRGVPVFGKRASKR